MLEYRRKGRCEICTCESQLARVIIIASELNNQWAKNSDLLFVGKLDRNKNKFNISYYIGVDSIGLFPGYEICINME